MIVRVSSSLDRSSTYICIVNVNIERIKEMGLMNKLSDLVLGNLERLFYW